MPLSGAAVACECPLSLSALSRANDWLHCTHRFVMFSNAFFFRISLSFRALENIHPVAWIRRADYSVRAAFAESWHLQSKGKQDYNPFFIFEIFTVMVEREFRDIHSRFLEPRETEYYTCIADHFLLAHCCLVIFASIVEKLKRWGSEMVFCVFFCVFKSFRGIHFISSESVWKTNDLCLDLQVKMDSFFYHEFCFLMLMNRVCLSCDIP